MTKLVEVDSVTPLPNGTGSDIEITIKTSLFTAKVSIRSPAKVQGIPVDPVEYARGELYRIFADLALEIGNSGSLRP
jgi:hypothetical protein